MTLNLREKILVFVLSIVVVLFIGVKLLLTPAFGALSLHTQTLLDMQTKQAIARANLSATTKLNSNIQKAAAAADSAAASILPSVDNAQLNLWILGLTGQSGLTLSAVKFSDSTVTDIGSDSTSQQSSGSSSQSGSSNGQQTTAANKLTYLLKTYAEGYKSNTLTNNKTTASNGTTAPKSGASALQNSSGAQAAKGATGALLREDVTLELSGTYDGVKAFLDAVQNSGKTVRVISLDVVVVNNVTSAEAVLACYGAEKPDNSDTTFTWNLPAPSGKSDVI